MWGGMRLVHASYKRAVLAVLLVAAIGLAASFSAAGGADARPRSTVVVPNGTYGAAKMARGEYVVFKVRNRRVYDAKFQFQITCEASDMPGLTEQRFFTASMTPQGHIIPANGRIFLQWRERGNGRLGNVTLELKFATDVANFSAIVPEDPSVIPGEGAESCDGVSSLRFRRGYEVPPIPAP